MAWWNIGPDAMDTVLKLTAAAVAGAIGTVGRIYDQMTKGERAQVFNSDLVIDITGFFIMLLVAAGIAEYMDLGYIGTAAISGVLCREGTPLLDSAVKAVLVRITRGGK